MKKPHHLIFEGAELSGKSHLMNEVYQYLEPRYNHAKKILDGCHWFNCDIGVFGSKFGRPCIESYIDILQTLRSKNVLFEKFHLSDIVYHRMYSGRTLNYRTVEKKLQRLNAKIILTVFEEDEALLRHRIQDRLRLYPHYRAIAKSPAWYIRQQREYIKAVSQSALPHLIVDMTKIPGKNLPNILQWLQA